MQIPAKLSTPQIKLGYGEEVLQTFATLRRKLFASRYGELHLTNQRVAFVTAVAEGVAAAGVSRWGVKPAIVFERGSIRSIGKVVVKRGVALEITDHRKTERFVVDETEAETAIALLS
jgi:hypothetical protein